jgi:hypothetical protein
MTTLGGRVVEYIRDVGWCMEEATQSTHLSSACIPPQNRIIAAMLAKAASFLTVLATSATALYVVIHTYSSNHF